ncbi:MAG: hypothetical protein AB7W16_00070 [Candidatus Obscuribacterales bacterium]
MNEKVLNRTFVSLKLAAAAALVALVFSGLQMIAGTLLSLGVIAAAAAFLPWIDAWRAARRDERQRSQAEASILSLYDEIQRSGYGYGEYDFKADAESRFVIARSRAAEVQQALRCRFAYLNYCRKEGIEPLPGAGWVELDEHAARHIKLLRNAAYWSIQGLGSVNPDLLDPGWTAPADIHPGGLSALRALSLERKVVPMSEFETLRRPHKRRRGAPAAVVDLTSQAGGDSL